MDASEAASLLFAYGTLRRGAPMHALLEGPARYLGPARFAGRLWDLGHYPGVTDGARHVVHGELYALPEPGREALLDTLDRYEGDAFRRSVREVVTPDGERHRAYLYLFLGSTRRARPIDSGDYLEALRTAGPAAHRG